MKRVLAALAITLTACQPNERQPANEATAIPVDELGYPTRQPDGSPLTAAFCGTEQARQVYDNIKTCSMVACDQGDKESCKIAQVFATQHAPEEEGEVVPTTTRLEDMSYSEARRTILSLGWKPVPGDCTGGGVDGAMCRQYPEIGNCQGTWPAFCDMHFDRRDRCLTLVTYGGPPGADTVIRDVTFSRGPCFKDPNDRRAED